ncbi:MAG: DUF6868 family protein [Thiohalomonadales bacterium]
MNIDQLTEFFKWMLIINVLILLLSSVLAMTQKNLMCKLHGKLFNIKEENVSLMAYGYLGMLKVLITVFILVPYISLLLIK